MILDEEIKRFNNNAEYERTHGNLQGCLDFRQLVEFLKELKQLREQTRWIPVSERLPKDYSSCLCTIRNHYTYDNHIEVYDHVVVYNPAEKEWLDESSKLAFEVIAWMPLPEPYKENEK